MFAPEEVRWFSETVRALYVADSAAGFVQAATSALYGRLRLCCSSFEELSVGASSYVLHGCRSEAPVPPDHVANFHDCPLMPLLNAKDILPVWHMREVAAFSVWARTDHFNGIARPMGWNDHICLIGQTQPSVFYVGLQRDRMFSSKETALLRLLQPHVAAVWPRVRPTPTASAPAPLRIVLSPELRPLFLSPAQRTVLRAYFPRWREGGTLPAELQTWATHSLRQLRHEPLPHPLHAFAIESARGRLLVRCFPSVTAGTVQLFLVETPARPNFLNLQARGLTARECEVLHWLAQGKRDTEIAAIIGCASGTVSKHVEHVLAKLRAENRVAAVSAARRWLQPGG